MMYSNTDTTISSNHQPLEQLLQMSKSSLLILILALPILLSRVSLCAVDPQFEVCRNQTTCGHLNISFPFFIQGRHTDFCGFPGFDISCMHDHPILNLSNALYLIGEIDYRSQSLRVSNAAAVRNWTDSCEHPWQIQNLTLPGQFELEHDVRTLFLFYNCSMPRVARKGGLSQHQVNCSGAAARNSTLLGLYDDDPEMGNALRSCKSVVEAPVEGKNIREVAEALIRRGFRLRWTASDCSICENSGGKCGFDYEVYHFKCFCPDRAHAWHCTPGKFETTVFALLSLIFLSTNGYINSENRIQFRLSWYMDRAISVLGVSVHCSIGSSRLFSFCQRKNAPSCHWHCLASPRPLISHTH